MDVLRMNSARMHSNKYDLSVKFSCSLVQPAPILLLHAQVLRGNVSDCILQQVKEEFICYIH